MMARFVSAFMVFWVMKFFLATSLGLGFVFWNFPLVGFWDFDKKFSGNIFKILKFMVFLSWFWNSQKFTETIALGLGLSLLNFCFWICLLKQRWEGGFSPLQRNGNACKQHQRPGLYPYPFLLLCTELWCIIIIIFCLFYLSCNFGHLADMHFFFLSSFRFSSPK